MERVYAHWSRYEDFPRVMDSVRRVKRIGEQRVLWDVDIAGRQVVWEARIVEVVPHKLIRWESCWGAAHSGVVRFDELPDCETRLCVEIDLEPGSWLERIAARLGLVDAHVARDLARFRLYLGSLPPDDEADFGRDRR